ncbi:MAG: hypothetical protein DMG13_20075 [Acidobacteria bacterium]|nr:MAG: hypothetical protein DMG13_20075 [Acidobacteriota bacterium]
MPIVRSRFRLTFTLAMVVLVGTLAATAWPLATEELPKQLSDEAFWQLVTDFSEPGGFFRSDNFVSNETTFQWVIPDLKNTTKPGGVYLGVGPDQNFTYIVAVQPQMAFIFDIRRQNMIQHLMYKALIELSADRVEFLSRLFSRKRPEGIEPDSSLEKLFRAVDEVEPDRELFYQNFEAIKSQLVDHHGFKLTAEDQSSLEYVFRAFYSGGPDLTYNGPGNGNNFGGRGRMPSYAELMMQNDGHDLNRSYMSTEESFHILQDLEKRNLLVPLVGDFAGSKAIRAVAEYLKQHDAFVTAFYTSNVEQYLFQQNDDWSKFYANVGTLPVDPTGLFIRSVFNGMSVQYQGFGLRSASVLCSIPDLLKAFESGQIRRGPAGYYDVIQMSIQTPK